MFVVARTCGNIGTSCNSVSLAGVTTETCGCTGDECNSAGYAKASVFALLAAVVVPFVLFNWNCDTKYFFYSFILNAVKFGFDWIYSAG